MILAGGCQAEKSFDEGHFNEAAEVQGGFFESCKDAPRFLEPADEAFDDVALAIGFGVELDGAFAAVLIFFRGNDRCDSQIEQVFIDPIGAVSLVAAELRGPSNSLAVAVEQLGIGSYQHVVKDGGIVGLPWRQMKMERMAQAITQEMDFCRKTPARTA